MTSGDAGRDLSSLRKGFWEFLGICVGESPSPESGGESHGLSISEVEGLRGDSVTIEGSDLLDGGGLSWAVSEGSLSETSGDGISTGLESGGADLAPPGSAPYPGIRVLTRMLYTRWAASSESVWTNLAGIQPTSDPSPRTAPHHPDSSCWTISRISCFRNERRSGSVEKKS